MIAITTIASTIRSVVERPEPPEPEELEVNAIVTEAAAALTVTTPVSLLALYPLTIPSVYTWVPFGSLNPIDGPVLEWVEPPMVTDQLVPDGSPVSVKVTA
jgi:hypothetical protein